MNRKVVFLDIDGTLVNRDGIMPESAKEALRTAKANGHEMVLCTGRSATQIVPVMTGNEDLFSGVVSSAGANVKYGDEVIWRGSLSEEKTKELVDYFRANTIYYFLQAESGIYTEKYCMETIYETFAALGYSKEAAVKAFGETIILEHPEDIPNIEKCCYYQCQKEAAVVQEELGDYFQVVDSSIKMTRFCDGEICKNGVNKATGMKNYLEARGVPHEDSICFGDGPNDFEMMEYAATGVAMGNGVEELKKIADRVAGDINEDGLYNEFKALGLI